MEIASKLFGQAQALITPLSKQGLAVVKAHPLSATLFAGAVGTALYTFNAYQNQQWADRMLRKRDDKGKVDEAKFGHVEAATVALTIIQRQLLALVTAIPPVKEVQAVAKVEYQAATQNTPEVKAVDAVAYAAPKPAEYKLKDNVTFTQLQAALAKIDGLDGNQWTVPDAKLSSVLAPVYKGRDEAIKAVEGKIAALKVAEIKAGLVKAAADFIAELKKISGSDSEAAVLVMEKVKKKLEDTKTLDEAKANLILLRAAIIAGNIEAFEGFKETKGFTAAMKELLNAKVGAEETDTLQAFVGGELTQKIQGNVQKKIEAADAANAPQAADNLILNKLMFALDQALLKDTGTLAGVHSKATNLDKPVSGKLYGAIAALVSVGALVSLANRLPGLQDVLKKNPWIA